MSKLLTPFLSLNAAGIVHSFTGIPCGLLDLLMMLPKESTAYDFHYDDPFHSWNYRRADDVPRPQHPCSHPTHHRVEPTIARLDHLAVSFLLVRPLPFRLCSRVCRLGRSRQRLEVC